MIRLLLTAAAAATIGLAPTARADQYDFISYLDNNGIYYSSISDMIDAGKVACHGMRAHMYGPIVAAQLDSYGYWTLHEKSIILTSAANNMCPDVWSWIRSQSGANQAPPPPAELPPCAPNCGEI